MFDREDKCEYETTNFNLDEYLSRTQSKGPQNKAGILVLPCANWRGTNDSVYMPDTFDFVKWTKNDEKSKDFILLAEIKKTRVADLKSNDFWLPLVYLFSDTSLQIYLNIVASYIYNRLKGALQNDNRMIDVEAYVEDKKKGQIRKFSYHGSYEGFRNVVKKVNVNELLDK